MQEASELTRARLRFGVLGFGCASSQAVSPIVLLGRVQHKSKTPSIRCIIRNSTTSCKFRKIGKIRKNWGELGKIEKICEKSQKEKIFENM